MTSVRLTPDLEAQLDELCRETKRSRSFYIKEALREYLEDTADYYIALARVKRKNRKLLTTEEMFARLEARQ